MFNKEFVIKFHMQFPFIMCECFRVFVFARTRVCSRRCVRACVFACMCVNLRACVCVCVCVCAQRCVSIVKPGN